MNAREDKSSEDYGRISQVKNRNTEFIKLDQPRLIGSLMAGFHSVANHAWVILIPMVVDLILWFSPRLKIGILIWPTFENALKQSQQISGDNGNTIALMGDYLKTLVETFNLSGAIRSYPIGVPSLLAGLGSIQSPLGEIVSIQIGSFKIAFMLFLGLSILGFLLGNIFFHQIAGITRDVNSENVLRPLIWKIWQSFILTVSLVILAVLVLIPGSLIISLLSLINPWLGQLGFFLYLFLIFWFAVPWFYSFHGIYVYGFSALKSTLFSLRAGRIFISKTATLILLILVISQGMNILWMTPSSTSWLLLLGIFGHAIVSAGLLSATVIYYRQINVTLAMLVALQQKESNTA